MTTTTTAPASARGFTCPACRLPLDVIRSSRSASGVVVRRRACPRCPHRITTEERTKATRH